jgi:hypothetical protein
MKPNILNRNYCCDGQIVFYFETSVGHIQHYLKSDIYDSLRLLCPV